MILHLPSHLENEMCPRSGAGGSGGETVLLTDDKSFPITIGPWKIIKEHARA